MRHFRTGSSSVIVIAVGLLYICPANAGRKRQQRERASTPVGLVKFDLSALGPRSEPITDLRSTECQVSEDGKHQVIALFHYDGDQPRKAAPARPQEFSNRDGSVVHPTVILLDLLSERVLTWGQAGEELVKSLQSVESAGSSLPLCFLMSRGTFDSVHPLPRTEAELQAASPTWTQQIRPLFDVVSHDLAGFRPVDDQDPWLRSQLTIPGARISSRRPWPRYRDRRTSCGSRMAYRPSSQGTARTNRSTSGRSYSSLASRAIANVAVYTVAQSASERRRIHGLQLRDPPVVIKGDWRPAPTPATASEAR